MVAAQMRKTGRARARITRRDNRTGGASRCPANKLQTPRTGGGGRTSGRGQKRTRTPATARTLKKNIYTSPRSAVQFSDNVTESRAAAPAGSGRAIWKRGANYEQTCFSSCWGVVARLAPGRTVCGAARRDAAENAPSYEQNRPRCDKYRRIEKIFQTGM